MSYKSIFLSILSATLLILAFPKPDLWWLAWVALAPWFLALQEAGPKKAFLLSYILGLLFFGGTLWWVNYVSRLGFSLLILYLAIDFALFGLFFSLSINHAELSASRQIRDKLSTINNLFIIPSIWVALEYIRGLVFGGFPWALLASSQYRNLAIIQISDLTGAYGVSFLVVLVNVGIWQALTVIARRCALAFVPTKQSQKRDCFAPSGLAMTQRETSILRPVFCILFSLILVLGYGYFRLNQPVKGQEVKVAVVQGNISQWMKWDPKSRHQVLEKYLRLTEQAAGSHPELIIWPETSVPGYLEAEPELLAEVSALSKRLSPAYMLVGTPQEGENNGLYNSASLIFNGKIIQRHDKLHLVPFGEFIPWPWFFSRFAFASLIGSFTPGENFTVFSLAPIKPEIKFSALICFEDIFSGLARKFVQKGAGLLINMTNDAWFYDSGELKQHVQASVFRAVENRVNLARSANTGISCFIDPCGRILGGVTDDNGREALIEGQRAEKLTIAPRRSFYTLFGDVFAWACLLVSGIFLGKVILARRIVQG